MFDIGFLELLIIGVVALIVVGPKDLPGLFRTVGKAVGKARGMAREFQRSMEEAADESGLKETAAGLRETASGLNDLNKVGLQSATKSAQDYAKGFVTGDDDKSAQTPAPDATAEDPVVPKPEPKPATDDA